VLDEMPEQDVVCWTTSIQSDGRKGMHLCCVIGYQKKQIKLVPLFV